MSEHNLLIAVTGTPGTGKTTFAKRLSESLPGAKPIELNDLVDQFKLYSSIDDMGSKVVKIKELEAKAKELIKGQPEGTVVIIVGHLAAELKLGQNITVVTRLGLYELIKRLNERNYQKDKIKENLVSESTDYCGEKSREISKETYEIETEEEWNNMLEYIKEKASGASPKAPKERNIDKMNELMELVIDGNKYGL